MSDTHTGETRAVGFEGVTLILRVRSVAESIAATCGRVSSRGDSEDHVL